MTVLEVCAGGGGMALGLERAGLRHAALVESDPDCCATLRANRSGWNVVEQDIRRFDPSPYKGVWLLAGGLPCPPFSIAGKRLGETDERNLFPEFLRIAEITRPQAVMIENVRGIMSRAFADYRERVCAALRGMGYLVVWRLLNAADYGVPQRRVRSLLIAVRGGSAPWPALNLAGRQTAGEALGDLMAANGWPQAASWARMADKPAPTIVGGSKKHGGPDLGPSRSRSAWLAMGVDGSSVADDAPGPTHSGMPRLTLRMIARLQGFPDGWIFCGGKTSVHRQIGNALPPAVAEAAGKALIIAGTDACKQSCRRGPGYAGP